MEFSNSREEKNKNIRLNVLEKRCKEIEEREKIVEGYWHSLKRVENDIRNLNELVDRVFRLEINLTKFSGEWGKRITEIDNYTRLDLKKRIEQCEHVWFNSSLTFGPNGPLVPKCNKCEKLNI